MATRSLIARANDDGTITAVYCHWDGYIEEPGVGYTLHTHYQEPAKIDALLAQGGISSLGEVIGEAHSFNEAAPEGMTTFYHRDRGEELEIREYASDRLYWSQWQQTDAEYQYLFVYGVWYVKPRDGAIQHLSTHYALKGA